MKLERTIISFGVGITALGAVGLWAACAPKQPGPSQVKALAPVAERLAALAPVVPMAAAASAAPAPPAKSGKPASTVDVAGGTVADVLDHSSCSTEVVRALSEQIIAEQNCIHPSTYLKVPAKVRGLTLDDAVFPYLMQPAHDALLEVIEAAREREPMTINSMLRTIPQQYLLYDWYKRGKCHIKLAATPGRSNHQSGLAIDIAQPQRWKAKLQKRGFKWMGAKDRVHFDFVGRNEKERDEAKHLADMYAGLDVLAFQRLHNRNHPDATVPENGDFNDATEAALRRAPVRGFAVAVRCGQ